MARLISLSFSFRLFSASSSFFYTLHSIASISIPTFTHSGDSLHIYFKFIREIYLTGPAMAAADVRDMLDLPAEGQPRPHKKQKVVEKRPGGCIRETEMDGRKWTRLMGGLQRGLHESSLPFSAKGPLPSPSARTDTRDDRNG